jgi:hypothetical protein
MRSLIGIAAAALVLYFALSAYAGLRVARGIDGAKAHSIVTRVGVRLLGRTAVERLAIRRGDVPAFLTASPTFWMALHANE